MTLDMFIWGWWILVGVVVGVSFIYFCIRWLWGHDAEGHWDGGSGAGSDYIGPQWHFHRGPLHKKSISCKGCYTEKMHGRGPTHPRRPTADDILLEIALMNARRGREECSMKEEN